MLNVDSVSVMVGPRILLRDISVSVCHGENWAILGANGVGKSSLLRVLSGITQSQTGTVSIDGVPIGRMSRKKLATKIGLLPQIEEHHYWGSVRDYVGLGRYAHNVGFWGQSKDDEIAIDRAIDLIGVAPLSCRDYLSLSGGEKQRVRIASLMSQEPVFSLWDEPLENLDYAGQMNFLMWLSTNVQSQTKASLAVIHDINLAARFFSHVMLLYPDGTLTVGPRDDVLSLANIENLYQTQFEEVEHHGVKLFVPESRLRRI